MKITSVEIHPAGSSAVHVLSFRDPKRLNPYNIRDISGLDADNIVPQYYSNPPSGQFGTPDTNFHSLKMVDRQITLNIELNPEFASGQTYSDLRDNLYRIISSSRTGLVQLQFINDDSPVAGISGFVVKFEASLFDSTPTVKMAIATVDPVLRAIFPTVPSEDGSLASMTTISFSGGKWIRSLTINDLISTAPHGFTLTMTVSAPFGSLVVEEGIPTPTWSFIVNPAGGFLAGDLIRFSSEINAKEISVMRTVAGDLTTIQLADAIQLGSVWPIIFPGWNNFNFEGGDHIDFSTLIYYSTFWGI